MNVPLKAFEHSAKGKLSLGYPSNEIPRDAWKKLHETSLIQSLLAIGGDWGSIMACGLLSYAAWQLQPTWLAVFIYGLAITFIARQQRALECLVHEASHWNLHRTSRTINDFLGSFFAAVPVFSSLGAFRALHAPHHLQFGGPTDPDKRRHRELNAKGIDRTAALSYSLGMARRMPIYMKGWWVGIGTNKKVTLQSLLFHALFIVLPLAVFLSITEALWLWTIYWAIPFALVLPILRFVGELEEHDYPDDDIEALTNDAPTMVTVTWTNRGLVHWFLHPHGDGFHVEHHGRPGIPGWNLPAYRRAVDAHNPPFAGTLADRTRFRVL